MNKGATQLKKEEQAMISFQRMADERFFVESFRQDYVIDK